MSEPLNPGLAGLLSSLQPRVEVPEQAVLPDLDGIRHAGWEAGYAAGEAAATAALAPMRDGLAAAAKALEAACVIDADRLRPVLAALVEQVATAVLTAELDAGAAVLNPLVEAALAQVRPGETAFLRAHPVTLAVLAGHFSAVAGVGDAAMAPGEFAVTAPGFVIEAGLSARLAEIVAGLA